MARFVCRGRLHISPYAACCYATFFKLLIPALAGRFISGDEGHGSRQRHGYRVTPKLSLSCPMRAGNKAVLVQNTAPLWVKQAAYGETRTAIIKKKLMKTKFKCEAAAPANAVQQSSTRTSTLPRLDYKLRRRNQQLPTQKLLALLEAEAPEFWRVAHLVGQWVWIQFRQKQPPTVTSTLSQLGFHWNRRRMVWQHPCGHFATGRADYDPRRRYGSHARHAI